MDVQYLKRNVNEALNEALTSMAVACPDDNIEYLGHYLTQYVLRKDAKQKAAVAATESASLAENDIEQENLIANAAQDIEDKANSRANKLTTFCETLGQTSKSKSDAMDAVTIFLASFLDVPSVYVALNKVVGESETLLYFSTNPENTIILGQKLPKATEAEGEDAPTRQGVTFRCFKIPEVPEPEPIEDGEESPPVTAPTAQPLIIENTMRNSDVKFFGIPKLGAFAAIPLSYGSSDHEAGCVPGPSAEEVAATAAAEHAAAVAAAEEAGEPAPEPKPAPAVAKYVASKIPISIALCMDTVGRYKRFTQADVDAAKRVGDALMGALNAIEAREFEIHGLWMDSDKKVDYFSVELVAKAAEEEAAAVAGLAESQAVIPDGGAKEAEIAKQNTAAVFDVIQAKVQDNTFLDAIQSMENCILPPPLSGLLFLHCLSVMIGFDASASKDICGDLSWGAMRANVVPTIVKKIMDFSTESAVMDARAMLEANGVNEAGSLPVSHFPFLPLLLSWATKAMASKDADVAFVAAQAAAEAEAVTTGGEED